jgi:hypothetical protein
MITQIIKKYNKKNFVNLENLVKILVQDGEIRGLDFLLKIKTKKK